LDITSAKLAPPLIILADHDQLLSPLWARMRCAAAICAAGLHRRVLVLRLCQAVLLCLGLAFNACARRADRARAASAGTHPQPVLL